MIHIIDLRFKGVNLAIASFLIETSEGPIIVETGPHSTLPILEKALSQRGYRLEDVQHVFLTHIHLDHAGAAWAFAEKGATIYMHPFGKRHSVDPSRLIASAKMIYKDEMETLWGQLKPIPADQIVTVKHGETFEIGGKQLIAWHTPGHAVHHIAWQMGDALIAGDVAGVKIGEKGMIIPPCPPPDINIEHWIRSIELIEKLELKEIYLTHFGKYTDLEAHFAALKNILWDWANWMRPYYEQGVSPKEVVPKFEAYIRQQLIDFGISKADLVTYENANPSWMSVMGLMRYWKKKLEVSEV